MKLVITKIDREFTTKAPSWIQVTVFNQIGAEQSRIQVPINLFGTRDLEVGQRLLLMPVVENNNSKTNSS